MSTARSYRGTSPGGRDDKPYTFEGDFFIFKNGEIITITHTYLHNGKYWGVMSFSHTYQPPGWIPMDELLVAYDFRAFEALNNDVFYTYTGSSDAILSSDRLVLWQWPGSDGEKRIIDDEYFKIKDIAIHRAYMDEDGREWGYASIDLEYVYSDGIGEEILGDAYYDRQTETSYLVEWICLSDPGNSNIPSFNPAPKPANWSPDGIYDETADVIVWPPADNPEWSPSEPSDGNFNMPPLIVPVIVVVVGVAFVIWMFRKKPKPNPEAEDDD